MKNQNTIAVYEEQPITFTHDAWFSATEAGKPFGVNPANWLQRQDTRLYLAALTKKYPEVTKWYIAKSGKNSLGTWFHPKLAVAYSRWLSIDFSIWCDEQIDAIIRGGDSWNKSRAMAAASYKIMSEVLQAVRLEKGKETNAVHFMSEAKLVNWCLKGEFEGLDRSVLPAYELDMLGRLEAKNCVLLGLDKDYATRKIILKTYAEEIRISNVGLKIK